VDFVVCTPAVKKKKKIMAGFDMSDRTIPLLEKEVLMGMDRSGSGLCTGGMWYSGVKYLRSTRHFVN
jgi:hypothetical protein